MPEQKIETGHSPIKFEKRKVHEKNREAFIVSGIEEQSDAIARWSLSPTPIPSFRKTKPEMAEALSYIEIVDPNIGERVREVLERPEKMTKDDMVFITSVALAKTKVAEDEGGLILKEKRCLEQFKKTVLSGVGKIIGKTGGEKALRATAAISLALTACTPAVVPQTLEATQRIEPTATETVQVPTEVPTPTEISPTEPEIEAEPKAEEVLEDESLSTELNEDKIRELSEQLECRGTTCISETIGSSGNVDFEYISSGVFENIELKDESTKETIGSLTVLSGVSKDRDEKPIVVQIVLQIELLSDPGVNALSGIYRTLLMMNGASPDNVNDKKEVIELKEWKEMMPEGSEWTFLLSKDEIIYIALEHTYFKTQEYNQAVSGFINSSGTDLPADFIVVPSGVVMIPIGT